MEVLKLTINFVIAIVHEVSPGMHMMLRLGLVSLKLIRKSQITSGICISQVTDRLAQATQRQNVRKTSAQE